MRETSLSKQTLKSIKRYTTGYCLPCPLVPLGKWDGLGTPGMHSPCYSGQTRILMLSVVPDLVQRGEKSLLLQVTWVQITFCHLLVRGTLPKSFCLSRPLFYHSWDLSWNIKWINTSMHSRVKKLKPLCNSDHKRVWTWEFFFFFFNCPNSIIYTIRNTQLIQDIRPAFWMTRAVCTCCHQRACRADIFLCLLNV